MIDQVREHIRLLAIFHYVVGGIGYLFSMIPCIHLAIGIFFLVSPEEMFQTPPPVTPAVESDPGAVSEEAIVPVPVPDFPAKLFGLLFTIIPSIVILCGIVVSTLIVIAGKRLAAYRSHTYCLVIAGVECLFMPFGTVLGIFTILTLIKPEARQLFGLPPMGKGSAA